MYMLFLVFRSQKFNSYIGISIYLERLVSFALGIALFASTSFWFFGCIHVPDECVCAWCVVLNYTFLFLLLHILRIDECVRVSACVLASPADYRITAKEDEDTPPSFTIANTLLRCAMWSTLCVVVSFFLRFLLASYALCFRLRFMNLYIYMYIFLSRSILRSWMHTRRMRLLATVMRKICSAPSSQKCNRCEKKYKQIQQFTVSVYERVRRCIGFVSFRCVDFVVAFGVQDDVVVVGNFISYFWTQKISL